MTVWFRPIVVIDTSTEVLILARVSSLSPERSEGTITRVYNHLLHVYRIIFSHTPCATCPLCARSNKKACAKSSFVHVNSLRSGANVPTRIKSLFCNCIENNYSDTEGAKAILKFRIRKIALYAHWIEKVIFL